MFYCNLVCVATQSTSDDRIHIQTLDLGRIPRDHVAELVPELMVGFSILGDKLLVVDTLGEHLARLVQPVDVDEIGDVLLAVLGKHLQVATEYTHSSL